MQEQIHTIPLSDAFLSGDECPFCFMEREAERRSLRYVAGPGASYMEPEVRGATNAVGFCRRHVKSLYDYGNTLGSALMLQSYYDELIEDFRREAEEFQVPGKKPLFGKRKLPDGERGWQRMEKKAESCFLCDKVESNMDRYFRTFFSLLKEEEFRRRVENCKGFCMPHFARLLKTAEQQLPNAQREWFYATVFPLMEENLVRVKADLDWLINKFDYRNAGADWRNSRDALQRTMQKLEGGYVADPPFQKD